MALQLSASHNPHLYGQEAAEREFLAARDAGKLPHAWIFSGARGIGKATLAYRLARAMLAGDDAAMQDEAHPIFRRVAALSHADLLAITPPYDEKKEEAKQEIPVEEVRRIGEFLSLTPAEGEWRVVIIDSADALNVNAANALLKVLEEPPRRALLLLISHNPAGLLPTIRSRCRRLRLSPLSPGDFHQVMQLSVPDLPASEEAALMELSFGSPGVALEWQALDGVKMQQEVEALFAQWPLVDGRKLTAFSASLHKAPPHARWQAASAMILRVLARAAAADASALVPLLREAAPAAWALRHAKAEQWLAEAARAHLDYRSALIGLFEGKMMEG